MKGLRQHKLTRVEVHPSRDALPSWIWGPGDRAAHKRRRDPWVAMAVLQRARRSQTPKTIPSAVHPYGALGGDGSKGGGSPCMRWLADYRHRRQL